MYISLMDKGQKSTFSNRKSKMMYSINLSLQGWEAGGYRAYGRKVDFLPEHPSRQASIEVSPPLSPALILGKSPVLPPGWTVALPKLNTEQDGQVGSKGKKSNFIPLSPSLFLGWPGGFSNIWEAGTSVNSDFSSWKANVSKFHWETVSKERDKRWLWTLGGLHLICFQILDNWDLLWGPGKGRCNMIEPHW